LLNKYIRKKKKKQSFSLNFKNLEVFEDEDLEPGLLLGAECVFFAAQNLNHCAIEFEHRKACDTCLSHPLSFLPRWS
jgi:Fe-S-cluster containining protein